LIWQKLLDLGVSVGGKSSGHVRTLCPKCSDARKKRKVKCLSVEIEGESATGLCHHCGWRFGAGGNSDWKPIRTFRKPDYQPSTGTLFTQATKWFKDRGISEDVLRRNRIEYRKVYMPQDELEVGAVCFPYFRDGQVVNVKYRSGKKHFRMETGAELCLYGLDDISGDTLIWVEGEIDKLSLEVSGFTSCVSVPNGAPPTQSVERHLEYLSSTDFSEITKHILAGDADLPGRTLQSELVRRLGPEKCWTVAWPEGCKDANDVLLKLGADELKKAIEQARPVPIVGTVEASDVYDELIDIYELGHPPGASPGSAKLAEYYTVKPGQISVVTGIPSHGKSAVVDWLMSNLALIHGWRFAVCSPENQPVAEHVAKLAEIYIGLPFGDGPNLRMSKDDVASATAWIDEHFTFISPEDDVQDWSIDTVLSLAKSLVLRKGIKGLILDPWNEFEHLRSDRVTESEYISQSLSRIRRFARLHQVHVWIVAHPFKLQKEPKSQEYPVPTLYDVSGSSHWYNKADMGLSVWRNVKDEDQTVQIHIQKVRFKRCGKVGMVELVFDKLTNRYADERTGIFFQDTRSTEDQIEGEA